jgi:hypothetical protein
MASYTTSCDLRIPQGNWLIPEVYISQCSDSIKSHPPQNKKFDMKLAKMLSGFVALSLKE